MWKPKPNSHNSSMMPPAPQPSPLKPQDPVTTFLRRTIPPPCTTEPSEPTLETLQTHAASYRWADVLQQSTHLLAEDHSLPPDKTLLIQTFRALALLQTRQIQRATDAITALGDLSDQNPVYRYESYQQYSENGSFIPFLLRLLAIDVRFRQGDLTAIADAYKLLPNLEGVEKETVLSALASYHLKSGLHDTAIDVTKQLVELRGKDADSLLVLTRVYLHLYDIENAQSILRQAENADGIKPEALFAHRGMILAAQGRYDDALREYDHALEKGGDCWVYAMNNSAICLLQLGRLKEAVDRLEDALRKDPAGALDEGLVFNLATLYQLAFPDSVVEKKRVLRKVAERFGRQGFDLEGVGL